MRGNLHTSVVYLKWFFFFFSLSWTLDCGKRMSFVFLLKIISCCCIEGQENSNDMLPVRTNFFYNTAPGCIHLIVTMVHVDQPPTSWLNKFLTCQG